ncbi:DNA-directed RNA polymerase subunit beta [Neobacillus mesonae]|uniref:DNA-directed RNA polymerase subunit beta n=1 Tax=Neobacillus mesonae TaxID=1193713 RepID=UPI0020411E37|nr:DNA-directed RNA polymerase subunit beta [Neobacillus mesonae]MCM3571057.1 DNA-directed RNA polymerase subunit beta [Neobacillus mesonae]
MALNNVTKEQVKTREDFKEKKKSEKKETAETSEQTDKRIRVRLIPIWLRLILLVVFMLISVMAGAAVGYGVLGNGKPIDVFKVSTWTHIIDLVEKEK